MLSFLLEFVQENGLLVLIERLLGSLARRVRDRLLARRLKTTGLRLGKYPKLAGLAHIQLGHSFSAGNGLWLEAVTHFAGIRYSPLITIGSNVSVSDQVHIASTCHVSIGNGVLVGSRVLVTDHGHGTYAGKSQSPPSSPPAQRPLSNGKVVLIGSNVWIGDGVVILGGAEIGDGSIIGANSVVTGRIDAACIAVGTPARPIRRWSAEYSQWIPVD